MTDQAAPYPDEMPGADTTPNPARMYDYMLGGAANFAPDRAAVAGLLRTNPQARIQARANRAFLRRVVQHLADAGIRQFLDLGSGVPTAGHVHQIAQRAAPESRVVYVDSEPVAATFSRQLLAGVPGTAVLQEDLVDVDAVLHHPALRGLLDLSQPVAVLMFAVLHFIDDDAEAAGLVAAYRERTVPGSWLAVSHVCADDNPVLVAVEEHYRSTSQPFHSRSKEKITALFDGYRLVEPGVVYVEDWHPDPDEEPDPAPPAIAGGLAERA
jgi:hypothetical protein